MDGAHWRRHAMGTVHRKAGLTIAEHEARGARLLLRYEEAVDDVCELSHVYPVTGKIVRRAQRVVDALRELRSELDGEAFREDAKAAAESGPYFGDAARRRAKPAFPIVRLVPRGGT